MENGINLMDTVMYNSSAVELISQAQKSEDEMMMQAASGSCLPKGTYSRTRVLSKLQRGFLAEAEKYTHGHADMALSIVLTRFVILKRSLLFLIACNQVIKCRNCAG
jgi:predicted aldo/keto reductase-like oxidoreductase